MPTDSHEQRLGPYRLLGKLGQGGMGEVHLASDSRLERKVALKLLPDDVRADPERRARFLREARAVAQLSHPNIAQIFEVGEVEGRDFLAFELIEGRTLENHLAGRQLELVALVEIALPLADAIAYAHERGIVHRDLKATNVMITARGHAKLLDFGLAKILNEGSRSTSAQHGKTLTMEGAVVGTPGAMSPEQALGRPVDSRSDIFSFGSMLYQMAAGRDAFRGETAMEILQAVILREPDPLERVRPDLPAEFVACVAKALRKESSERYQTMNDLAADLRHFKRTSDSRIMLPTQERAGGRMAITAAAIAVLAVGGWLGWRAAHPQVAGEPVARERRALAVLPFTNLGDSADDATFSAGLHSDVLTCLAKIGSLKIIARTSVLEYTDARKPLREIGRELGVSAILTGEVQRADNALRFNLMLHDAASDDSLWAETYNREISSKDLFAVQSEIAEAVAHALQARLSPADEQQLRSVPTTNDQAYAAYLTASALREKSDARWPTVIASLESSVAFDPRFALAWASLAEARGALFWSREPTNKELLASAFDAARRALKIDPSLPEGHLGLGGCHYHSRDYEAAEREYEIAQRGLPNSADLLLKRSSLYRRTGRWSESLDTGLRAVELSPREAEMRWSLAMTLLLLGRYDEAIRHMELERALRGMTQRNAYDWIVLTNRDGRVSPEAFEIPATSERFDEEDHILRWRLRILARDLSHARSDLDSAPVLLNEQWHDYPSALLVAIAAELGGDTAAAQQKYEEARTTALAEIQAHPDDARPHAPLALALAGLGQRDEALREARRAEELLPIERDSIVGGGLVLDRFYTELRVGALDDAVRTLERYLAHPALFSLRALVLDPRLDVLKEHPGFEALKQRKKLQ